MDELPSDLAEDGEQNDEWKYDLAIDVLLAFGIALNIYFIVDVATDGRLSEQTLRKLRRASSKVRVAIGVARHRDKVIEEAHEALYTEDDQP